MWRITLSLFPALLLCPFQSWADSTTTRIEENDPSITYSGSWYKNFSPSNTGGAAALTNSRGARATVTFSGTGISWIGVADPWSGVARVYLDGTLSTVDTYGKTTEYQHALFTARGLTPGPHTLSIEVAHMRDSDALGSWVWIDAFDIENGSGVTGGISAQPGLVEHDNPALLYSGIWFLNTNPVHVGGSAVLSVDRNSSVTITFTGTGISWIGYRDEWSGIAKVYVDGSSRDSVDTYSSPEEAQVKVYTVNGLTLGTHSLTIQVSGTHDPQSRGSWIWVEAFEVTNQ